MINKIKQWLNKGEGGEFYESYVTNRGVLQIMTITIIVSTFIVLGCYLTTF